MLTKKLRILILKHLAEQARSGYKLIKDIEEHTGWKPSYGSMYPALEHLKEEGLITFKEEGRKKVYTLTSTGKEEVKAFSKNMVEMIGNLKDNMKLMAHMMGFDDKRHDELVSLFIEAMQEGKTPFGGVMNQTTEMKLAFWELYKKGLIKKREKEINQICEEATKKLKQLM